VDAYAARDLATYFYCEVSPLYKPFVNSIRAAREKRGVTRYRLAQLTGIAEKHLYAMECAEHPRPHTLIRIANALCCNITELMGQENVA
jgi:transcriptional regulator with XRE-family HTH domain